MNSIFFSARKEMRNRKIMYFAENFSPKTPIYHKFITKFKGISLYDRIASKTI